MPWFQDFVSAAELVRRQTRDAGHADPVMQYLKALNTGDTHALERAWPGELEIYDPLVGEVRGHRHVRQYIGHNVSWLAGLHARTETIASTRAEGRAVVELLAHVDQDGGQLAWPVAVVAESPDDLSVIFRIYCMPWPIDEHHLRPSILGPGPAHPGDVVGRYQAALAAGDTEAVVNTFAADGYLRGPLGSGDAHRGRDELHSFFTWCFSAGGGIGVEDCAVTDDGQRCALEYNIVRWGSHDLPPQAGLAVYERGPDGLLAAARIYDSVEAPGGGRVRPR